MFRVDKTLAVKSIDQRTGIVQNNLSKCRINLDAIRAAVNSRDAPCPQRLERWQQELGSTKIRLNPRRMMDLLDRLYSCGDKQGLAPCSLFNRLHVCNRHRFGGMFFLERMHGIEKLPGLAVPETAAISVRLW